MSTRRGACGRRPHAHVRRRRRSREHPSIGALSLLLHCHVSSKARIWDAACVPACSAKSTLYVALLLNGGSR